MQVKGALFPNEGRGPAYKGFVEIDGQKIDVVCWQNESKKTGKPYLAISNDKPREQSRGERRPAPAGGYDDRDSPF